MVRGELHLSNRKTFADHIVDNFTKYKRCGYYQQVIFIGKNIVSTDILKEYIKECARKANDNLYGENISGICLYYTYYSSYMIEGLEDIIAKFMEQLVSVENKIFEKSCLLIIINNVQKVGFTNFIFRTAQPPTTVENLAADDEEFKLEQQGILINQFLKLFTEISEEVRLNDYEVGDDEHLSNNYVRLLASTARLENVFTKKGIFKLSHYIETYGKVPPVENMDEKVWPIPYDYVPKNIFNITEYDVNLTFPDADKKLDNFLV